MGRVKIMCGEGEGCVWEGESVVCDLHTYVRSMN